MDALLDSFEIIYDSIFFERQNYSDINFEKCKDGNFTFKITSEEKSVYIHSKYNPEKEAEKFVKNLVFEKDTIFIIFGFGLGYHIRELLKTKSRRNFYIIYEPNSSLFSKIVDERYCDDIFKDKSVFILSKSKIEYFESFLKEFIDSKRYYRCKAFFIPNYEKIYKDKYIRFIEVIKKIISDSIITKNTSIYNMKLWTENNFNNTENMLNSYATSQMIDIFKDKTAVIVAAGPSLKKNMHLLKEIKGKIPIISVFVAAKVLLENGIVPDFIVSSDAKQSGMKKGMYDDIALIYDLRVPKEFVDNHNGTNIFLLSFGNDYPPSVMKKYNKKIYVCSTGGSVACDCVSIAKCMGAKNIILIGQDLAFTENKRHIDGTEHKEKNDIEKFDDDVFEVPAVGGGTVFTNSVFSYYIGWFEEFALKNKYTNLIDATEGGALIKNTEVLTFREAIDKYGETFDVNTIIKNFIKKGPAFSKEEKQDFFKIIDEEFKRINDLLKIIQEEEEIFDKYIKSLKFHSDLKGIIKLEKKLDNFDKKIEEEKEKITILAELANYIKEANENMVESQRINDNDKFMESALIRKNRLINLKNSLEFVKDLKER